MTALERESARYLGYGGAEPDAEVGGRISRCLAELDGACTPRFLSREAAAAGLFPESRDLKRHLEGCGAALLFAATLGLPADRLLSRWAALDLSLAVVGQACAAALLEDYCDACMETMERQLSPGRFLRPRFSPGYGDFPLERQKDLLLLLDAGRRMGLTLTGGLQLTPAKSVTAVIGISESPDACHVHKCERCPDINCTFRKV